VSFHRPCVKFVFLPVYELLYVRDLWRSHRIGLIWLSFFNWWFFFNLWNFYFWFADFCLFDQFWFYFIGVLMHDRRYRLWPCFLVWEIFSLKVSWKLRKRWQWLLNSLNSLFYHLLRYFLLRLSGRYLFFLYWRWSKLTFWRKSMGLFLFQTFVNWLFLFPRILSFFLVRNWRKCRVLFSVLIFLQILSWR
jgi:hypothetical protein